MCSWCAVHEGLNVHMVLHGQYLLLGLWLLPFLGLSLHGDCQHHSCHLKESLAPKSGHEIIVMCSIANNVRNRKKNMNTHNGIKGKCPITKLYKKRRKRNRGKSQNVDRFIGKADHTHTSIANFCGSERITFTFHQLYPCPLRS